MNKFLALILIFLKKVAGSLSFLITGLVIYTSCNNSNTDIEQISPDWTQTVNGVYESKVFDPSDFNLLSVSGKTPRIEAIQKLSESDIPIDLNEIEAFRKNGKTYLRFPLDQEEQIYGLGLNFRSVRQRGKIKRLHVDHFGREDNGRTHAPVPFFISSKGYGVLVNAARYIDVYVGVGVRKDSETPPDVIDRNTGKGWSAQPYSDNLEIIIPEDGVELVLFTGASLMEVVQRFNLYCGSGIIPPKWGLGFWHRTPTLFSDVDVAKEVASFETNHFPLDVIGLEPGWQSKSYPCTFEWDSSRFPEPGELLKDLNNNGIRVNLWMNPYLWPGSTLDNKMKPYTGTHTVWNGSVPDYTMPKAKKIFQEHLLQNQLNLGISGFKIDEVDGYDNWVWPDIAQFPSGLDGEQMRQTYGMQVMEVIDELYRSENRRSYGLVRGTNAGSVSYPYVIYNDSYSHRSFITALINSSFSGVLWTPEVRASTFPEDWIRRMQSVCFSPMAMINAWSSGTKPWSFPEVYEACQDVAFLRMQLLPYIYSTFAQYYFEGKPPFRAMELTDGFGDDAKIIETAFDHQNNPYSVNTLKEVKDQYLMGDNILVAPMFIGEKEREIVLPEGNWYDFYTGDYIGNGEIIIAKPGLNKIPLFVRDGGVIPMIPKIRQTSEWVGLPLEIRVYGQASGSFDLYDDDGVTFDFEKGEYSLKSIKIESGKGTITDTHEGPWTYDGVVWKFMTQNK